MRTISLIAVLLLTACASQPPATSSYLLRSAIDNSSGTRLEDTGIALGNLRVASYIDQPGLVLARGDGKIHAARNHVWAEPLPVSLRRFLANQISAANSSDVAATASAATKTNIDVTVDQLHGTESGSAVLVAYWEIASDGISNAYRFAEQQALTQDGYDALVQAEEILLIKLANAIAASLADPTKP